MKWAGRTLDPIEFQNKMNQKNANYIEYISGMNTSELLPDVDRVLKYLTNKEQYITLGSASKNARPILDKVKITGLFDAIVDGNDVSKAKPNPEVFLRAAKQTKSKTKNCIVFEDSVAGIQAANKAGMTSVGIGDPKILHEAQYNFQNFKVMSNDFLEQLIKK